MPTEPRAPEVYIPRGESGGALHGDVVEYRILRPARGDRKPEGIVTRILERGLRHLTGVVAGPRRRPWLIPDHPRLPDRMRLLGPLSNVAAGQRVLCRLHDAGGRAGLGALVEQILGDADDAVEDIAIIAAEYGLPDGYPPAAVAEAERARVALDAKLAAGRRDFSAEDTITIDPEDACDFDDAVSLQAEPDGGWRLRVFIADVAEVVARDGALDGEARRRGNSTYLPGKMIPMLPEILAADAMSLAPGHPKAVLAVSMRIRADGTLSATRIEEGVIVSRAALAYDRVQAVLTGRGSLGAARDAQLLEMDRAAQLLRARRFARGGFDLQVPESEVVLGADGMPLEIRRRRQERSHQIVEEFMILANRVACDFAVRRGHPYLFRVHAAPDPLAVAEFCEEVPALAPEVRTGQLLDLAAIRHWLAALPPEPRTWRIHALFLRSLKRAVYAFEDHGHFGLGLRGYGHFTSPIRRYPDLFNHRVVKWAVRHGARPVPDGWRAEAFELGPHCSATEERSEDAERALVRLKSLRWAQAHLGDSFRGCILGVQRSGFYVELDDVPVDGFVPRLELHAAQAAIAHRRGAGQGRGDLELGHPVIVQIVRVDFRQRALILGLRAAGRRALEVNPESLEPLTDPWAQGPRGRREPRRGRSRRAARGHQPHRPRPGAPRRGRR